MLRCVFCESDYIQKSGQSDQVFCVFCEAATGRVICTGMYSVSSGLAVWSGQTYAALINVLSLAKVRCQIDQLWSRKRKGKMMPADL